MTTALTIITLIGIYFVPTIVAWIRSHNTPAVFALNLFLGWTLVGWVVALVMALWNDPAKQEAIS